MPVILKHWVDKNILFVGDLLSESNEWLSLEQLNNKFNVSLNWLEYRGILNAMPDDWQLFIRGTYWSRKNLSIWKVVKRKEESSRGLQYVNL